MPKLKPSQRVKYKSLRGTILTAFIPGTVKVVHYTAVMDNGARVLGTNKQLTSVVKKR